MYSMFPMFGGQQCFESAFESAVVKETMFTPAPGRVPHIAHTSLFFRGILAISHESYIYRNIAISSALFPFIWSGG